MRRAERAGKGGKLEKRSEEKQEKEKCSKEQKEKGRYSNNAPQHFLPLLPYSLLFLSLSFPLQRRKQRKTFLKGSGGGEAAVRASAVTLRSKVTLQKSLRERKTGCLPGQRDT